MDGLREFFENNKTVIFAVIGVIVLLVGRGLFSGDGDQPRTVTRELARPDDGSADPFASFASTAPAATPAPAPTPAAAPAEPAADAPTHEVMPSDSGPDAPQDTTTAARRDRGAFDGYPEISSTLDPEMHQPRDSAPRVANNPFRDFKMDRAMETAALNQISIAESEIRRISGEYSDAVHHQRERVQDELVSSRELLAEARTAYHEELNYLKAQIFAQRSVNATRLIASRVGEKILADSETAARISVSSISYSYKGFFDLGQGPVAIMEKLVLSPDVRGGRKRTIVQVQKNDKLEMAGITDEEERWARVEAILADRIIVSEVDDEGESSLRVHYLDRIEE